MTLLQEYDTPQEAYIVKGMLEANGIETYVSESGMSSVFPAPDSGTGTTSLYVAANMADKARKLLGERGDL